MEAVSDEFGTASARFLVHWANRRNSRRAAVSLEAGGTRYGSTVPGDDADVRVHGSWRTQIGRRVAVDGYGSWWQFRRAELQDFNVDMGRISGRLAWTPRESWLVSGGVRRSRIDFTDRLVLPDTTGLGGDGDVTVTPLDPEPERDHQTDAYFALLRRLGSSAYAALEFTHRDTDSNEPQVRSRGPIVSLRLGQSGANGLEITGYVAYVHRRYDEPYQAFSTAGSEPLPRREDEAWQFGFGLERPVAPRVRFFADGSWLDQSSNIEDFAFDHARFSMGITVELWSRRDRRHPLAAEEAPDAHLAPRRVEGGLLFRFEDPEAEEVYLVGEFNAWDARSTPLNRVGEGVFEVRVPLQPGIWRYAFVVDGSWVRPPGAPRYEPDGFGGENGVVEVPGTS